MATRFRAPRFRAPVERARWERAADRAAEARRLAAAHTQPPVWEPVTLDIETHAPATGGTGEEGWGWWHNTSSTLRYSSLHDWQALTREWARQVWDDESFAAAADARTDFLFIDEGF